MKIYIINQYDIEPWETYYDGIHAIFSTKEKAERYLAEFGLGPHYEDEGLCLGYYLSDRIEEWEVA